jgi:hypothetical protein
MGPTGQTETDPVSEALHLIGLETIYNVQNNNHIYGNSVIEIMGIKKSRVTEPKAH